MEEHSNVDKGPSNGVIICSKRLDTMSNMYKLPHEDWKDINPYYYSDVYKPKE